MQHFVVVGAGQAGLSLVAKLRTEGFEGKITLVGAEDEPPYQRPPLSKAYLLGEMVKDRLYLRPESFYADQGIDLKLGMTASALDCKAKTVTLSSGEVLEYDALALTTGSEPRRLPAAIGGDLGSVITVRDLNDADAMAPYFIEGKSALVIGGGYIGLEAAAVAAKRGVKATLVEMADRILQRVACRETSDYFRALHTSYGVDIAEGVGLDRLDGDGHVQTAKLTDGRNIDVDFVIVGVGIEPRTKLAESGGLEIENGIKTDEFSRTSDPSVWAAGDCASCPVNGTQIRIESVGNAIDQAEVAAHNMMGKGVAYVPKPWFWSDQYDCKLQIAGLNIGYNTVVVRAGDDGALSHWYYAGDTLLAVDAMNDPRNYMIGKRLIEAGKSPAPSTIADPETDMKALLKA
ncbi:NAD(P)/FAD-dependent oxidoreductase [Cognatiyoonia sp.]|uniref:NAD(P)/FAD-dependent oxidoreductase n=1 Tax=Cognatiyoonia sp. TaxID=2211652 RepID=UPI003F6A327D